jgi:hypothetical protein
LFDGKNISFDASLFIYIYVYIYNTMSNISPIMIINRIYEHQNLPSLDLISFLIALRTYQHPCTCIRYTYVNYIILVYFVACYFRFFICLFCFPPTCVVYAVDN